MERYLHQIHVSEMLHADENLEHEVHTLNVYGDAGWELVAVKGPFPAISDGIESGRVAFHYFFKKPISDNQRLDLAGDTQFHRLGPDLG
ncbi:hypothetical protein OJ996_22350 [Luteolibacter sp. GHJ8]|uniref:DUF4177 domain-containing protein n=1 Tax=Luteolibacter rhizosphaerae TaxID=2989719 RepID=A0ABT3G921_9BACT|nr:hypothetical protein [Luteolibacter rhizosphaerae]MCW1916347.1 hypothetical protein [Luteolibacter rhizosphaerae]